ncbi:MAG: alpha/beta hydrolase [Nostoc sp. ChiSLP02]|nr:alpha/beta hydrolase [Nostoc sp. DedSLP05]MDZ8103263.1 alpha/beta hydrolase [Nostoc sp. DedSLP01]MDZ8187710.1 alpha/beta hydrolase [Nostoc sp. ChiSLP02]
MGNNTRLRAALGATEPWKTLEVDGINLAYNDDGIGLPIICLHAIGHGASDYLYLRENLCNQYRVIAIDFPGHGNSDNDMQPVSASRYSELLALFLDKLRLDKVVIIGNSIGGATAIKYAYIHPERVLGLILANPGGLDPMDSSAQVFIKLMVRIFSGGMAKAWWYPKAIADFYRVILPKQAARSQRKKILASSWEMAPYLVQAWQSFAEPTSDLRELISSISCPVLFTWALRDPFVQLRRCLPAINKFPNAQVETFNAGHSPHLETPTEFEQSVRKFLMTLG